MKFCFFGNISCALKGQTIGGGELQVSLLAKALANDGHEIVIIDPSSSESLITEEGIRLISVPNWNKGIRGMRLFTHRIPALKKLLIEQNADYYYVRMRSYLHYIPYLVAKRMGKKFIQAIAHDLDVLKLSQKFKFEYKSNFNLFKFLSLSLPNDLVFSYLLKRSDYIIIQHLGQVINPPPTKGRIALFPNILDFGSLPIVNGFSKDYYVHVGALTVLKGAENLDRLITSMDQAQSIIIIGEPRDDKSKSMISHLSDNKNIILKGRLSHRETLKLIAGAKGLISTSNFEGFPNVFLEAWAMGVPVISLNVNPGNVFSKYQLGVCCEGNLENMKNWMESNEITHFNKESLIKYVKENHDFLNAGVRFTNILKAN
jgi:glycosyltransferase involved in cell wall biosynthesis